MKGIISARTETKIMIDARGGETEPLPAEGELVHEVGRQVGREARAAAGHRHHQVEGADGERHHDDEDGEEGRAERAA